MKFWTSLSNSQRHSRVNARAAACLVALSALSGWMATAQAASVDPELKQRLQAAVGDNSSFADQYIATVWLTDMALRLERRVEDPEERVQILQYVHEEAARVDLPPELVLAVIDIESAFDRFAVSVAGARGLMQVMPFWLAELEEPDANLFDIRTNLRMGCTILRHYYDMETGDWFRALGRYNGSLGRRTYPDKVMERLRTRWFQQ